MRAQGGENLLFRFCSTLLYALGGFCSTLLYAALGDGRGGRDHGVELDGQLDGGRGLVLVLLDLKNLCVCAFGGLVLGRRSTHSRVMENREKSARSTIGGRLHP